VWRPVGVGAAAVSAPAAAVADPAEFLDVQMNQISRAAMLVPLDRLTQLLARGEFLRPVGPMLPSDDARATPRRWGGHPPGVERGLPSQCWCALRRRAWLP
jgi:hypothetical protein